jgi:hypothetical protein
MPIQVRGVLVHAMSGTELSRVRTEFRLRLPEPINKSSLESRGPTLLCNQVNSILPLDLLGLQSRQQLAVCRLMRKLVEERLDSGHRNF